MKKLSIFLFVFVSMQSLANEAPLEDRMKVLDTELFEFFNNCQSPGELKKYASYFSPDVEFYHDNGGVTWDRRSMISNTKKNACGNYTRKLVAGSFKAYPINQFGAITEGVHIFCETKAKKCEGKSDFVMVWRNVNNKWEITRALSYGHRENK
ncbi:nuclear transport factor 2 family protein [Colwellia sp. MB02u-9]|uniref:nuclear transport factor 2 family protein n=1 Tax=Colwellia sp. MB02u-9 TaxID=2759823 RepID=UPI0015F55158|nr:nuclear transport factor 2 family protein [Colwellia sp. MB02u-9]MBA6296388.1 nuclear transport factor 2 family protein [Colwellia sp. MB02u-9]